MAEYIIILPEYAQKGTHREVYADKVVVNDTGQTIFYTRGEIVAIAPASALIIKLTR